jgi:hypothetical protein
MKGPSEGVFGAALREVELLSVVYKPPDDARNWKPCDFMWWGPVEHFNGRVDDISEGPMLAHAVWFEVKDVATAVESFPFAELRPSQLQGIRDAARVGIPYWLAVWWRRHKVWTISDAVRVLAWRDNTDGHRPHDESPPPKSIPRVLLASRFGVDSTKQQLASTLKQVLLGEADA